MSGRLIHRLDLSKHDVRFCLQKCTGGSSITNVHRACETAVHEVTAAFREDAFVYCAMFVSFGFRACFMFITFFGLVGLS